MMRAFLIFAMIGCSAAAWAQGGPPMVTDDPETPGPGKWEINLGAIGEHTDHWSVDFPDADINYGVGEHIQLKLDVPLTFTNEQDRWRSAIGETSVGVKWRFIDESDAQPWQMSMYPQFVSAVSDYSKRIGAAPEHSELFLPVEIARKFGEFEVAADAGYGIVEEEPNYWEAGVVAAHSCGSENLACLLEVRHRWQQPTDGETLLNAGLRWKFNDTITLMGAAGREFGARDPDQRRALIYVGVQILH